MTQQGASEARPFRRFIGISLGGGRGKTTAVARLEPDPAGPGDAAVKLAEARTREGHRGGGEVGVQGEATPGSAFRDDVLLRYLDRWVDEHTVVAFDAPLTLPPCVRCQLSCPGVSNCTVPVVEWMREHAKHLVVRRGRSDPGKPTVTPYTQRATELLLERVTLQPREALGQGMGPLAARAAYLRRALSPGLRLHENLIEVHPRASLIRLFGVQRERSTRMGETAAVWEQRKQMLSELTEGLTLDRVWPDLVVRNGHVFHAVVAAFTSRLWAEQGWKGPADLVGEAGKDAPPNPKLREAIDALGSMWLEDGWIWAPPRL